MFASIDHTKLRRKYQHGRNRLLAQISKEVCPSLSISINIKVHKIYLHGPAMKFFDCK
jgi:hypothetical protein